MREKTAHAESLSAAGEGRSVMTKEKEQDLTRVGATGDSMDSRTASSNGVVPYEMHCGCFLRILADGAVDGLRCAFHSSELWLRLSASRQRSWQPIATAPKDGTRILAATRFLGYPVVELIRWDHGRWEGAQGEQRFDWWMPLPDPPA